jgi:HAD superfamily hydrolase (TIGR01509 family)
MGIARCGWRRDDGRKGFFFEKKNQKAFAFGVWTGAGVSGGGPGGFLVLVCMNDHLAPSLALVIFDCDGVLIDSEPPSRLLLSDEASRLGWALTPEEAHRFTGLTWTAIKPYFEAEIGHALPADWAAILQNRLIAIMAKGVPAMPGARAVLEATAALGLPYRIASNSSHEEMAEKFGSTGLWALVEGRMHSARDVKRGKPAPDVYLAAAASAGIAPACCIAVEDSLPGMAAAQAAGMRVIAFAPHGLPIPPPIPPDEVVTRLDALPALFKRAMLSRAA